MDWLKFAAAAMCVWGTTVFASLPDAVGGERQELQSISSWTARLNSDYPAANVSISESLKDKNVRKEIATELEVLNEVLHGQATPPAGSLMFITCSNIVCGGGGDGKCVKCSAEN
jgi:hypothetical protein